MIPGEALLRHGKCVMRQILPKPNCGEHGRYSLGSSAFQVFQARTPDVFECMFGMARNDASDREHS